MGVVHATQAITLRELVVEAAKKLGERAEVQTSLAEDLVVRRCASLDPKEQLRLLCEAAGYTYVVEPGVLKVACPPTGSGPRYDPPMDWDSPVIAAQTFPFGDLQPGDRVVFSSQPTAIQRLLKGNYPSLTWLSARRTVYGLRFGLSKAVGGEPRAWGFDVASFLRPQAGERAIALSTDLRRWVEGNRYRISGSTATGGVSPLLDEDPTLLLYRDFLHARFPQDEFLFLAKDATAASLFALANAGPIRPAKSWASIETMHGVSLEQRRGVWVGAYRASGVAASTASPWLREPRNWTPEALETLSLDGGAHLVAAGGLSDYGLVGLIVTANDTLGVSCLRDSDPDAFYIWASLTADQRLAVRKTGRAALSVGNGPLARAVERIVFRRPKLGGASSPPEGWPLGSAWEEVTFRLPNGLPADARLSVEWTEEPSLIVRQGDGRLGALTTEDLAYDLYRQMKKNPGGESVQPSYAEFAPVKRQCLHVRVSVGGAVDFTCSARSSVAHKALRFVTYDQVDKDLRATALATAKRMLARAGGADLPPPSAQ